MSEPLLKVYSLKKYFPVKAGFFSRPVAWVKALDDVSIEVESGEVIGLVGESGCGKTTLVNVLLNLIEPTEGRVVFDGKSVFDLNKKDLRVLRKNLQIVFQDPFWSLNPRMLVRDIVGEPVKVHFKSTYNKLIEQVKESLEMVGLSKEGIYKYPHEFSGGQRQRIAIARALVLKPKLLVLDEPTSSIDIISQVQILELLKQLKKKLGLTYILISHDLSVVNYMSDKIAVMYLGKIVEYGIAEDVFENPLHPYTKIMFDAIPDLEMKSVDDIAAIEGNVPSAINPPSGCRFHTRCPLVKDLCRSKEPQTVTRDGGHAAACHLLH